MATFTERGVVGKGLAEYKSELETIFRDSLGASLDLSGDSPQGQLIGLLALAFEEGDEAIVRMSNAFSLQRASGVQLDDLCSILGVRRNVATRSTLTATVTGRSGFTVPKGWRARTTGGDVWRATAPALITNGTASVSMEAENTGPVVAAASTLTQLVDLPAGIDSVTNAQAAALGTNEETDAELRARYALVVTKQSAGTIEAIVGHVRSVAGVKDLIVRANTGSAAMTIGGQSVSGHSVYVVVNGGSDANVAAAIAASKPAGIGTSGTESVTHSYAFGADEAIRFSRATPVTVTGTVTGTLDSGFPPDGVLGIQQAAAKFVNASPIGTAPNLLRYQSAMLQAVAGWQLTAYTLLAGGTDMTQSSYSPGGRDKFSLEPSAVVVSLS